MTRSESVRLRELAAGCRVLEVGAWLGYSTVLMAQVAKLVVSVDWHREDEDHTGGTKDTEVTLLPYMQNVGGYGVRDKVMTVVASSAVALHVLRDEAFDLAFIDGGHDHGRVYNDAIMARRCVRTGGVMVFHDYDSPGVKKAVDSLYGHGGFEAGPGSLIVVYDPRRP